MSAKFISAMQEFLEILRSTYNADSAAIVPGGGSYGMESVARQFANDKKTLVIRNGFFSYRWTQIIETGKITDQHKVLKAQQVGTEPGAPSFAPIDIQDATAAISEYKPDVVFAPHVETASGILISDDYIKALATATHEAGGIFVLDCVASGTLWVDMKDLGVDVLISAPQKGWSGSPAAGYVMFSERAREVMADTETSSFSLDLKKWATIADGYADGSAGYHATMPTDTLLHNLEVMKEAQEVGLEPLRDKQWELGKRSASSSLPAVSRRLRRRALRRRPWSSSIRRTPTLTTLHNSRKLACRLLVVSRCRWMSRKASQVSVSDCSAWTSGLMLMHRCSAWRMPSTRSRANALARPSIPGAGCSAPVTRLVLGWRPVLGAGCPPRADFD